MKKAHNIEELMVDYAEMTSLNFESEEFCKVREIQRLTGCEYGEHPSAPKYGGFDLLDMLRDVFYRKSKLTS